MPPRRPGYINVDDLMPRITVEQVASFYGVPLPDLKRVGDEIRCRCFLNCGRSEETGDRALAIKESDPAKKRQCHQYGCGRGGNLVSLCDLLKPGENMDGRPRGERFKAIARDMLAIVEGHGGQVTDSKPPMPVERPAKPDVADVNVPLAKSGNERARALVSLDNKFVVDPAEMSPKAASYFQKRPYLTPDVCREWRMGYLSRDAGGDRTGGTMRGRIVYPVVSDEGEVLTWFGRDPEYEDKHGKWVNSGKQGREPDKFHFVKGFHRRLELFGQHVLGTAVPGQPAGEEETEHSPPLQSLLVVEGPNDVIRLRTLGSPSVGLLSNTVTRDQATKIASLADKHAGGRVALMLDCDAEGENGMRQTLWEIAQLGVDVRLVWSRAMHDGAFADRQPESLSTEDWERLRAPVA